MAVSRIPRGQVRSYRWVAQQGGRPNSFRAVGQILHKNPLPFVIPCHRVIRSDGRLGGFMFGKKLKKQLLRSEGLTIKDDIVIINKEERSRNVRRDKGTAG